MRANEAYELQQRREANGLATQQSSSTDSEPKR